MVKSDNNWYCGDVYNSHKTWVYPLIKGDTAGSFLNYDGKSQDNCQDTVLYVACKSVILFAEEECRQLV